jgi:hypothetical protein
MLRVCDCGTQMFGIEHQSGGTCATKFAYIC